MSNQLTLEPRTVQGKKLKALRASGLIPSVIYGGKTPILAASSYNVTEKVLREAGYHSPIELDLDGKKQLAIVKDIALDPVNRRILNVEFQAISVNKVVEATTPIRIEGFEQSEAAKLHYALMRVLEEVDIKAKPSDLPKEVVVDGSQLATTDDRLTLADLKLPSGVELADKELDPTTTIANVYDPAAEAAARESEDQSVEAPATEAAAEKVE